MNSKGKTPDSDHRRMKRRPIKKGTQIEARKGTLGLGRNIAVDKVDVSEEGIQLIVAKPFLPGDELEIKLTAPGLSKPTSRVASVVWCRPREDGSYLVGARMQQTLEYVDIAHCT